jgi:predicted transcriptional regulator
MSTPVTLRVGDLMTADPVVVDQDAPIADAEMLLRSYRISGLPVLEDGTLVGVISQTDILNARSSELIGSNWNRVRVRHLMTRPAMTVHMDATVDDAARRMLDEHVHRLVVVDASGYPIGVVTTSDLLRSILIGGVAEA